MSTKRHLIHIFGNNQILANMNTCRRSAEAKNFLQEFLLAVKTEFFKMKFHSYKSLNIVDTLNSSFLVLKMKFFLLAVFCVVALTSAQITTKTTPKPGAPTTAKTTTKPRAKTTPKANPPTAPKVTTKANAPKTAKTTAKPNAPTTAPTTIKPRGQTTANSGAPSSAVTTGNFNRNCTAVASAKALFNLKAGMWYQVLREKKKDIGSCFNINVTVTAKNQMTIIQSILIDKDHDMKTTYFAKSSDTGTWLVDMKGRKGA